jgi:cytochrome c
MNMEFNKIFAAVLIAGILAYLGGFAANILIHPKHLAENAFKIEVAETSGAPGAAAPAEAEPVDELMAAADPAQGEKVAKVCAACHTFDSGGANKVGPNLAGIMSAKHAHKGDFSYSDAMKEKSGETWTVDSMNKFLWNPKKTIPGTKMTFAGIKKPEDRAALIKWLETQR